MGHEPLFLSQNLLNTVTQYPAHTLTAAENAEDVWKVADGRRSALDFWAPVTLNADQTLTCTFDQLRSFDTVIFDRGHNLAGQAIDLDTTIDAFATTREALFAIPVPSVSAPGHVDDQFGVLTQEGAWIKRFPVATGDAIQFTFPAMGAGLAPHIVGLWIGLSYSPAYLFRPSAPDEDDLLVEEFLSTSGWMGMGPGANRRAGRLNLQMQDWFEYELAREHLQLLFGRRAPTWICHGVDQAQRAVLAMRPAQGRLGLASGGVARWAYPAGAIEWVEHEPLRWGVI